MTAQEVEERDRQEAEALNRYYLLRYDFWWAKEGRRFAHLYAVPELEEGFAEAERRAAPAAYGAGHILDAFGLLDAKHRLDDKAFLAASVDAEEKVSRRKATIRANFAGFDREGQLAT